MSAATPPSRRAGTSCSAGRSPRGRVPRRSRAAPHRRSRTRPPEPSGPARDRGHDALLEMRHGIPRTAVPGRPPPPRPDADTRRGARRPPPTSARPRARGPPTGRRRRGRPPGACARPGVRAPPPRGRPAPRPPAAGRRRSPSDGRPRPRARGPRRSAARTPPAPRREGGRRARRRALVRFVRPWSRSRFQLEVAGRRPVGERERRREALAHHAARTVHVARRRPVGDAEDGGDLAVFEAEDRPQEQAGAGGRMQGAERGQDRALEVPAVRAKLAPLVRSGGRAPTRRPPARRARGPRPGRPPSARGPSERSPAGAPCGPRSGRRTGRTGPSRPRSSFRGRIDPACRAPSRTRPAARPRPGTGRPGRRPRSSTGPGRSPGTARRTRPPRDPPGAGGVRSIRDGPWASGDRCYARACRGAGRVLRRVRFPAVSRRFAVGRARSRPAEPVVRRARPPYPVPPPTSP